jgi:hypothetical protein
MDAVNDRECAALMARFDELDTTGSGRLDSDNIAIIAARLGGTQARVIAAGVVVTVIKPGSSKFGARGTVLDPKWNGLVKVLLDGTTEPKSYKKGDLAVIAEP